MSTRLAPRPLICPSNPATEMGPWLVATARPGVDSTLSNMETQDAHQENLNPYAKSNATHPVNVASTMLCLSVKRNSLD